MREKGEVLIDKREKERNKEREKRKQKERRDTDN